MASLIPTAEEEPAVVLAKFMAQVAWADAGEEVAGPEVERNVAEATTLLGTNRIADLVSLLLTASDTVLAKAQPKDVECAMCVLMDFVPRGSSPAEIDSMANLIATKLLAVPTDKTQLKLRLLLFLHNVIPAPHPARCTVLLHILSLASSAPKLADALLPSLRRLDPAQQLWWPALPTDAKRHLYRALTSFLRSNKSKAAKEASAYALGYLALFTESEAAESAEVKEAAAAAALDFLHSHDAFQSDLLSYPAVLALEHDPQHAPLFQLLHIFLTARFPQFTAFHAANPTALHSLGMSYEECETRMRLITVAALAADSLLPPSAAPAPSPTPSAPSLGPSPALGLSSSSSSSSGVGELRYALLQQALQLESEEQAERWIVRSISAGLISAKMDQLRHCVLISRASLRVFGPTQWHHLRSRLLSWKESIGNVSKFTYHSSSVGSSTPARSAA